MPHGFTSREGCAAFLAALRALVGACMWKAIAAAAVAAGWELLVRLV
jgi:hypothetical protein